MKSLSQHASPSAPRAERGANVKSPKLGGSAETPIPVARIPSRVSHYLAPVEQRVWLAGEIQDCRWTRKGDVWFTLRGDNVQLACVAWRRDASKLRNTLGDGSRAGIGSASATVAAGDQVVVCGRLALDKTRVGVRFVATHVQRTGMAVAEAERERVRCALERDGLLSPTRKRQLPMMPRLIALVTSPGSAAEADVLAVARERHPGVRIHVIPARVQGEGAAQSLVEAVGRAASIAGCDLVLLCRGGGSAAELSPFDDEALARTIARCPMPVVTGVGHETDITLADCVADLRALTPTAAAVAAVPLRSTLEAEICRLRDALRTSMQRRIERERARLQRAGSAVGQAARLRTQRARRSLDGLGSQLHAAPGRRLADARLTINRLEAELHAHMTRAIDQRRARRDVAAAQLAALGPAAILARGYSIARSEVGEVLGRAAAFVEGNTFILGLADGDVVALVLSASSDAPESEQHEA